LRARAEQKRREIIRVAAELFEKYGYERTSMSEVAARGGASKATLYNYFHSKEQLLRAVLEHEVNEQVDRLMHEFLAEEDLRYGLARLGIAYLSRQPARMRTIRSVANQPIAQQFYDDILRPAWQRLAEKFAAMMQEGRLEFADPWIAAMHWKGLTEWDIPERHLLSAGADADYNDIVNAAIAAAEAFLKIYAPTETNRTVIDEPKTAQSCR
jgi:AcrR family transcriptional regulator